MTCKLLHQNFADDIRARTRTTREKTRITATTITTTTPTTNTITNISNIAVTVIVVAAGIVIVWESWDKVNISR